MQKSKRPKLIDPNNSKDIHDQDTAENDPQGPLLPTVTSPISKTAITPTECISNNDDNNRGRPIHNESHNAAMSHDMDGDEDGKDDHPAVTVTKRLLSSTVQWTQIQTILRGSTRRLRYLYLRDSKHVQDKNPMVRTYLSYLSTYFAFMSIVRSKVFCRSICICCLL